MKERIKWVDVAKGYGIILVVYGHVAADSFSTWLYTFHVPLFFFLSGYFFNPAKSSSDFFRSKARGLLLPYLTLGIPLFLINLHFSYDPIVLLKSYLIQRRASTLWFIAALFMQFMIAYFLYKAISQTVIRWFAIGILSISGLALWHCGIPSIPWNLDVSMVTLPFFCLGHELRGTSFFDRLFSPKRSLLYIGLFLVINVIGTIIMCHIPFPTIDLCSSHFSFEPLAYMTALAGILAICLIANKWYSKYIAYIGKHSLVYFVWQQDIAIMAVTRGMEKLHIMESANGMELYIRNIIVVIASLLLLTILNEIIINTKLRILIGK